MATDTQPRLRFYEGLDESARAFRRHVSAIPDGARVLELGCGETAEAFDLAARGCDVLGVSSDPDDVDAARREAVRRGVTTARFGVMDLEALDVDDRSVDAIIGSSVLHRADVARAVAEMARVLDPDGRAVLLEPLGHNPVINAYRRRNDDGRARFEHPLRSAEFSLAARWFDRVDVTTHHLFSLAASSASGRTGSLARRALDRVDRVALHPKSPLRWQAWIAVIELAEPRP